jgi:alpha-1,6-mannosyltransferase
MPLDRPLGAVHRTVDAWLTPRRALTASVVSVVVVALIAATPGSPYHPVLPDDTGAGPLGLIARLLWLNRIPHGALIALGFVAMMAAGVAFLLVLYACERGMIPVRTVVTLTIAYAITVLLLPLLLSRDVFSYTYYGRIVTQYHKNPYAVTPADIPTSDVWKFVWRGWQNTPSVYGPVFVWLAAAITGMIHSLPETIFTFRAVAVGATLGSVWFVYRLMQHVRPSKTAYAVAFIGLNPVVLFHTAGGGHVDALVMLSIAAAIYLVATDRPYPATAMLTFGALVKVSAAVPLLLLIIYVAARADPARRTRTLAGHIGLAAGISAFAAFPFMQSTNPTLGMVQIVQHASWIAPPELLERVFEGAGRLVAGSAGGEVGIVLARLSMYAALLTGIFLVAKQVARKAPTQGLHYLAGSWGWALLLMMLFSPSLFPWYFCWVLPVAWALPMVPRRTLEIAFLALCTSQLTTENFQLPGWMHIDMPIGHPLLVVLLVWFMRDLWLRLRHDVPLDAEVDVVALSRTLRAHRPVILPDLDPPTVVEDPSTPLEPPSD